LIDLPNENQAQVLGLIHLSVKFADAIGGQDSEILHQASSLISETNTLRIEEAAGSDVHDLPLIVLDTLHLRVHDASIISFTINVVYLREAARISESGQNDMLKIDR
jgi:hypothetical protein